MLVASLIEQNLKKARYEYDAKAKVWCAWTPALPGAYAQGSSVEEARQTLAEVIEDYIIVSLQSGKGKKLFGKIKRPYAAALSAV